MVVGSVLIVDSDRTTVRQLVSLLSPLPLQLSLAFNKADAIETLLRDRIDLCVVAHGMADGNGLDLFRDSLCRRAVSNAVLLSRHADLNVVLTAVDAGFSFVISTPVDVGQLRPILKSVFPALATCEQLQAMSERSCSMAVELPDLKYIANLSMSQIRSSLMEADLIRIIRSVEYPVRWQRTIGVLRSRHARTRRLPRRRWSQQRIAARQEPSHSALDDCPDDVSGFDAESPGIRSRSCVMAPARRSGSLQRSPHCLFRSQQRDCQKPSCRSRPQATWLNRKPRLLQQIQEGQQIEGQLPVIICWPP